MKETKHDGMGLGIGWTEREYTEAETRFTQDYILAMTARVCVTVVAVAAVVAGSVLIYRAMELFHH